MEDGLWDTVTGGMERVIELEDEDNFEDEDEDEDEDRARMKNT